MEFINNFLMTIVHPFLYQFLYKKAARKNNEGSN